MYSLSLSLSLRVLFPLHHLTPSQNFLALCGSGAYDDSPFHRIVPGFIVQTGSPASDPKSRKSVSALNPPTDEDDTSGGYIDDEIRPALRHNARGIVAMANKGENTNGSQFFICLKPAPSLDGKNTVFGKVIDGLDVLAKFEDPEQVELDKKGRPRERICIKSVTVHANPLAS